MSLCETCSYSPWSPSNPVTEETFIEAPGTIGVIPTGEGPERTAVGSPFKTPLPDVIKLCCLDGQICKRQKVPLSDLNTQSEANAQINKARSDVYREAGLPAIG